MKRRPALWLMLCPWILSLSLLFVLPVALTLVLSFCHWDLLGTPRGAGLANFRELALDPMVARSLAVTFSFALLSVPSEIVGGLMLGLLMNQKVPGVGAFRTLCYLPTVLSGVAAALIGMWLFHPSSGLINSALATLGITGPRWLLDPHWALIALWLMSLWGLGRSGLMFLAALQAIPGDLYEAAALDGATPWKAFWHLTLPLLAPTLAFNLVVATATALQNFTGAYVATAGGPMESTTFFVLYLYQVGFQQLRMGYAAALSLLLFGLSFAVVVAMARLAPEGRP